MRHMWGVELGEVPLRDSEGSTADEWSHLFADLTGCGYPSGSYLESALTLMYEDARYRARQVRELTEEVRRLKRLQHCSDCNKPIGPRFFATDDDSEPLCGLCWDWRFGKGDLSHLEAQP